MRLEFGDQLPSIFILNERFGVLFATGSLDPGVHREGIGGYDPPRGTFHSPELSPEAVGSNEEHERN